MRPGIITKDAEGRVKCIPIYSRIVSLFAESNELQYAVPGGLIGVGLTVDPTLTRADRLVGQVRTGAEKGMRYRGHDAGMICTGSAQVVAGLFFAASMQRENSACHPCQRLCRVMATTMCSFKGCV